MLPYSLSARSQDLTFPRGSWDIRDINNLQSIEQEKHL